LGAQSFWAHLQQNEDHPTYERRHQNTPPHPPIEHCPTYHLVPFVKILGVTMGVTHCGLAIYIKKYRKKKEESLKLK
jgi:hypothetical protein